MCATWCGVSCRPIRIQRDPAGSSGTQQDPAVCIRHHRPSPILRDGIRLVRDGHGGWFHIPSRGPMKKLSTSSGGSVAPRFEGVSAFAGRCCPTGQSRACRSVRAGPDLISTDGKSGTTGNRAT